MYKVREIGRDGGGDGVETEPCSLTVLNLPHHREKSLLQTSFIKQEKKKNKQKKKNRPKYKVKSGILFRNALLIIV